MISNYKNIVVVYPPGGGGNHVANMLSTHDLCQNFDNSETYIDDLLQLYQAADLKFHAIRKEKFKNLDYYGLQAALSTLQQHTKINVLNAHFGELILSGYLLQQLPSTAYIVLTLPERLSGTPMFKRPMFASLYLDGYMYLEQTTLYTKTTVSQVVGNNNVFEVPITDLLHEDLSLLQSSLSQLDIVLPEVCETLHSIWYSKVCKK